MGLNLNNIQEIFDLQANPQNWPIYLIIFLIILLIVLYFILRRVHRNRRLAKFRDLGPNQEFEQVFLFLMDRFSRIGINVPKGQTILEFGVSSSTALRFQDIISGVNFEDLTKSYNATVYGNRDVSDESVSGIESYYKAFWKAARKQLGNFKYFFKSFRL
ncbi:MAG: hypothetical protein LUB61_03280 [Eggerthellaceae bacterium]|nr:hypothetical protein [Eggerthellaceae bacterium]